jgi:wobble nucleotide-excising tRNase
VITGIDIVNFGSFKDFRWDSIRDRGGNHDQFKSLNILYGRNYSGKTTLSQIIRTMESGVLPPNYNNPVFTVHTDTGSITQAQIDGARRNVRVFNRAFVDQHLSLLRRADGTIEAFAIFGAENKENSERIAEIEQQLGSVDGKTGLLCEQERADADRQRALQEAASAEQALENLLIKKATGAPEGIKHRSDLFGDANYNKTKLRDDIGLAKNTQDVLLGEEEVRKLQLLLREDALPGHTAKVELESTFSIIATKAVELITRKIKPSQPIQELLDDALLQSWVEVGMSLHREKRDACGFCQQGLPDNLWKRLDAHFDEAAKALTLEIRNCQESIRQEMRALDDLHRVPLSAVYAVHRDKLATLNDELSGNIQRHRATLWELAESLRRRAGNIFSQQAAPATPNFANAIAENSTAINTLVAVSNDTTQMLAQTKSRSRRRLLLNEVARFASDIQFDDTAANLRSLSLRAEELSRIERAFGQQVQHLQDEIQGLRDRQRDERLAARRVNDHLNRHFGHQKLRLEAVQEDEDAPFKFRIVRGAGNETAHNLSEGECSLVALCYFLAKLDEPETFDKRPIIWIDDPISSLDANHIYFAFSLIESAIAQPRKNAAGTYEFVYEQLFISTHSLEFLKYLGRLKRQGNKQEHLRYFLVAQRAQGSVIDSMPKHLQEFTTEFNFLFGEIHTCTDSANDATHHHCFYSFGSNLRRFLEAYLFFKYPSFGEDSLTHFDHRLAQFFGGGTAEEALVSRIANEGSHLGGAIDKAMLPSDCDEIARAAKFLLSKIKAADKDQYSCLLKSIGKSCPL